ncbi:amino acid ABC transporter periplasmic protein [Marinobacter lipolyticus SM19]|uniref:Amino acid ABC transporter periplasmic protein n=2 Tax=Marinobacter lipolyticus TaxID=209639 RepID=R8B1N9_9GAMM|nr:amino acid ABC transporter periplasmic protein [Marinobacter lipolyticus SM19]
MIVEIVDRIMPEAGLKHEVVFQPTWDALLSDTEEGRYQATFPWYLNEKRAQRFLYTDPLMSNYIVPFVLTAGHVRTSEREGLAGHRFCRPQGYFTHDLNDLLKQPGTTLEQPATLKHCFKLLKAGAVDVIPVDIFSAKEAIETVFDNPEAVRRLSFVFSRQEMHILVPKQAAGSQELVDRINLAIAKLELRGVLQSIRDIHANRFLRQYQ